jgi:hypothetical protein
LFDVNATMRLAEHHILTHGLLSFIAWRRVDELSVYPLVPVHAAAVVAVSTPSPQPIARAIRIQHGDDLIAATCIAFSLGVVFEREETGYMRLVTSSS